MAHATGLGQNLHSALHRAMLIQIEKDEWYPVYSFKECDPGKPYGYPDDAIEVDLTTIIRWQKTFIEFKLVQKEMKRLIR